MAVWFEDLLDAVRLHETAVLVTLVSVQGLVRNEAGSRMVVLPGSAKGSIGGGALEYQATDYARTLLKGDDAGGAQPLLRSFDLVSDTGQTSGYQATLLFEVFAADSKGNDWLEQLNGLAGRGESATLLTLLTDGDEQVQETAHQVLAKDGRISMHLDPTTRRFVERYRFRLDGSGPSYVFDHSKGAQASSIMLEVFTPVSLPESLPAGSGDCTAR